MTSAVLSAREEVLARLANEHWDLLIIGGGIVGSGVLLDATSRGLKAALLEQDDLAVGTSSRSSRFIHGGLRYLEDLRLRLVREALAERSRLLAIAPHLVRLERFLFPVYGWPLVHRLFMGAGLTHYDLLGAARDRDAVDVALEGDDPLPPSRTADLPLAGAAPREPLADDRTELEAEVAWAVERELALSLDDVLSRRMRLSMSRRDRGASVASRVAASMGARLDWDDQRQAAEVAQYLGTARREYDVPSVE